MNIRSEAIKEIQKTYSEKVWLPVAEKDKAKDAVAADLLRAMAPAIVDMILPLFIHLIEEEAKRMEIKTSGKGWIDSTNWSGYREAISDYKSRLIEAVKEK